MIGSRNIASRSFKLPTLASLEYLHLSFQAVLRKEVCGKPASLSQSVNLSDRIAAKVSEGHALAYN